MRKYRYRIDREGGLWHEGTEVRDPNVIAFFLRGLQRTEDGRLVVKAAGEENEVQADDIPYVVRMVEFQGESVWLQFAGGFREILDPETLHWGEPETLYARVRKGAFEARFTRNALVKLSERFVRTDDGHALNLGDKVYPIQGKAER